MRGRNRIKLNNSNVSVRNLAIKNKPQYQPRVLSNNAKLVQCLGMSPNFKLKWNEHIQKEKRRTLN